MSELIPSKTVTKRRHYSKDFKDRILTACEQPGASVAGVALANGLNANLVHKWRRLAQAGTPNTPGKPDFLPIVMPAPMGSSVHVVTLEVGSVKVHWPLEHIDRSIAWLRALQL